MVLGPLDWQCYTLIYSCPECQLIWDEDCNSWIEPVGQTEYANCPMCNALCEGRNITPIHEDEPEQ